MREILFTGSDRRRNSRSRCQERKERIALGSKRKREGRGGKRGQSCVRSQIFVVRPKVTIGRLCEVNSRCTRSEQRAARRRLLHHSPEFNHHSIEINGPREHLTSASAISRLSHNNNLISATCVSLFVCVCVFSRQSVALPLKYNYVQPASHLHQQQSSSKQCERMREESSAKRVRRAVRAMRPDYTLRIGLRMSSCLPSPFRVAQ